MLFLDKFWRGEIAPGEGRYHSRQEYSKAIQIMERCDHRLKARLSKEDYQLFREFSEAALTTGSIESCDNFIEGFRFGTHMMMDVLTDCS